MCNYWANRLLREAADRAMQVHGAWATHATSVRAHLPPSRRYRITEGSEEDPDAQGGGASVRVHGLEPNGFRPENEVHSTANPGPPFLAGVTALNQAEPLRNPCLDGGMEPARRAFGISSRGMHAENRVDTVCRGYARNQMSALLRTAHTGSSAAWLIGSSACSHRFAGIGAMVPWHRKFEPRERVATFSRNASWFALGALRRHVPCASHAACGCSRRRRTRGVATSGTGGRGSWFGL